MFSSSTTIETTFAGDIAFTTYCAVLSDHRIISIRSPLSSLETAWTLEPRIPTQAPTASILLSSDCTAIFALNPGSLEAPTILIRFCVISGTSNLNSSIKNSGITLERINGGPFRSVLISFNIALILS